MAINAFDRPAQAQFINTYSPIPFQEILQAGQSRQQKYDINRGAFEQMAAEANELRAIPNSVDAAYLEGTVIPTIQEIADKYSTQDYGNIEVVRNINKQIRDNIDRRRVANIQQSESSWRQAQSLKAKMLAEGKTPFKPFNYTDYDTSSQGIYTETPRATLDYEGALQNFFSQVGEEYLGDKLTNSGRIGSFHGRSLAKLQEHASTNVDVAAQDPAIQQLLEANDIDPNNKQAVQQFLLNEAPRFETSRMTGSYERPSGSTSQSFSGGEAIPLNLRTQPTEFTDKSFKDVQRQTKDYERQREDLEAKVRTASDNGQLALAESFKFQMEELDKDNSAAVFWKNEINNRTLSSFGESINTNVSDFKSAIEDIVKDDAARNKWVQAYSSAINKNIESEGFGRSAESVRHEYGKLFGYDDKDFTKWDNRIGYKQGPLDHAINKNIRQASKLHDRIEDSRNAEWETLRTQGVIEKTSLLPIVETASDFNNFPELRELQQAIKNVPRDFKIDIVSSSGMKSKERSKLIDFLHDADNIRIVSASESDLESPFIYVIADKKDDKGVTKSEVGYKVRLSEGQNMALANTYFKDGKIYEGVKWLDPFISKDIENEFRSGKKPTSLAININGKPISYKYINNAWYAIDLDGNQISQPLPNKEYIKADAYERFAYTQGLVQQ